MSIDLYNDDCLNVLKTLDDNSIDSIVTDPPYGLSAAKNSGNNSSTGFMGKKWNHIRSIYGKWYIWISC